MVFVFKLQIYHSLGKSGLPMCRVQVLRKSILKDGFQLEEYKKYFIGGEDTQTDLEGQVEFPQASVFKGLDL